MRDRPSTGRAACCSPTRARAHPPSHAGQATRDGRPGERAQPRRPRHPRDGRIFAAGNRRLQARLHRLGAGRTARTCGPSSRRSGLRRQRPRVRREGRLLLHRLPGHLHRPKGGVYYVAPDLRTVTPVLPHLVMANGVALSPDGKVSGPRSSAATSCTGSSLPTRLPRRRWGHRSPTVSPGRRRTRCGLTPTATSTSPSTARAA